MNIDLITLSVYFVAVLVIGGIFSRFNRNLGDFARGGAKGTWWMVGTSLLMAGISAFTFTCRSQEARRGNEDKETQQMPKNQQVIHRGNRYDLLPNHRPGSARPCLLPSFALL